MNRETLDVPAFPRPASTDDEFSARCSSQTGMTLRDYFAAYAMQAVIAAGLPKTNIVFDDAAMAGYLFADSMLKARVK
jgi:hypothetical protein